MLINGTRIFCIILGLWLLLLNTLLFAARRNPADSPWLYFTSSRTGFNEIFRIRPDGTHIEKVTNFRFHVVGESLSPDGKKLLLSFDPGSELEIFQFDPGTGTLEQLTANNTRDYQARWSPDGKQIAFLSWRGDFPTLYLMESDGTGRRRLPDTEDSNSPSWSPDGQWIVFSSYRESGGEIYKISPDGDNRQVITRNRLFQDESPVWSPDGEWITFHSDRDGEPEIYKMRTNGTDIQRLTDSLYFDGFAQWSPDGEWIAFVTRRSGNQDIYRMRPDGSDVQPVTQHPAEDSFPLWSPVLEFPFDTRSGAGGGALLFLVAGIIRIIRLRFPRLPRIKHRV